MLPSGAAFTTGFCGGRNPESHMSCKGSVTQGSAVGGTLDCTCTCHTDERDAFLLACFEATAWRTINRETNEVTLHKTEAEARAFAKSKEPACEDCNGTGAVPAGGGEPADDVDDGYVACSHCTTAAPRLVDVPSVPDVRPAASEYVPALPTGDRNHHLTAEGSERLRTWAVERAEV